MVVDPDAGRLSTLGSMTGHHVGFRVPNLEAALAWYSDTLEFRLVGRSEAAGINLAMMALPSDDGFRLELMENGGTELVADETVDLATALNRGGWNHVCLRVDSVDAVTAEWKRRRVRVLLDPADNAGYRVRVAFVSDPWGNVIELLEDKPA